MPHRAQQSCSLAVHLRSFAGPAPLTQPCLRPSPSPPAQVREQDSAEVKSIIEYFGTSDSYRRWTDTRRRGTQNAHILEYFQGKERSYGNDRRSRDIVRETRLIPPGALSPSGPTVPRWPTGFLPCVQQLCAGGTPAFQPLPSVRLRHRQRRVLRRQGEGGRREAGQLLARLAPPQRPPPFSPLVRSPAIPVLP